MSLKERISSPLEAGASIADGYQLPGRLNMALEYASKRLSRKAVEVTLLVVQREYQLPTSPLASPSLSAASWVPSPTLGRSSAAASLGSTTPRSVFGSSTMNSLRQLIRSNNTVEAPIRERIVHIGLDHLRNDSVSPAFSDASTASASTAITSESVDSIFSDQPLRWPASPVMPMTPATPFTIASSTTDTGSVVSGGLQKHPDQFGTRLVHVGLLSPREERTLSQTIEKASRKFKIGAGWLPLAVSSDELGLSASVVQRSVAQNEVLFGSESLTVLSLDHLYTFRTALQSYARTRSPSRLEDAVDELRRLILANGRRKLRKSTILTSYRWLDPVSETALADVCRMYSRAYGGLEGEDGIENDVDPAPAWPLPNLEVLSPPPWPQQVVEEPKPQGEWPNEREFKTAGTPLPSPPSSTVPQISRESTPTHRRWSMGEEKEVSGGLLNLELDDKELEIDAIEAWYRDVQLTPSGIHSDPNLPAAAEAAVEPQVVEAEEAQRLTPKLVVPPTGRNMVLRLQTTFEKPKRRSVVLRKTPPLSGASQQPSSQQEQQQVQIKIERLEVDADEDEMTARPRSAIVTQPAHGWNTMSIDGVMLNPNSIGPGNSRFGAGLGQSLASPISPTSPQGHVGPTTPNGYDDISPITRNEWGFLMDRGLPKTAAVEMC